MYGPHKPISIHPETNLETIKKPEEYTEADFLKLELDAKAFGILSMALPNEIFSGLLHCETAKEL